MNIKKRECSYNIKLEIVVNYASEKHDFLMTCFKDYDKFKIDGFNDQLFMVIGHVFMDGKVVFEIKSIAKG